MTPDERILAVARALWEWDDRGFPERCRQKWEEGTQLARAAYVARAEAALDAAEAEKGGTGVAEREACAKIADDYAAQKKAAALKQTDATAAAELYAEAHAAENIADAIRARGEAST